MSRISVSSWNALHFPKTQNFTHVNGNLSPSPLGELILAEILIKFPLQYTELCKHNLPKSFHTEQLPNVPVGVNIGTSGPIAWLQRRFALAKDCLRWVSSSNQRALIKGSSGSSSLINVGVTKLFYYQGSRTVRRGRDTEKKAGVQGHTSFCQIPGAPQVRAAGMEQVTSTSWSAPIWGVILKKSPHLCASMPLLQRGDNSIEAWINGLFLQ